MIAAYSILFSKALLEQIESTLNSLRFEKKWMRRHNRSNIRISCFRYGGEMKLAALVYNISSSTDAKLLGLLMTSFHLETHLQALKKFMLLGQVGWYQWHACNWISGAHVSIIFILIRFYSDIHRAGWFCDLPHGWCWSGATQAVYTYVCTLLLYKQLKYWSYL